MDSYKKSSNKLGNISANLPKQLGGKPNQEKKPRRGKNNVSQEPVLLEEDYSDMMAPKPMSTVQYTKNYSHNKMIIEIVNAADRIKGIIYPQKKSLQSQNKFKGRQKRERDVKNAEAEQTPQKRTGIFRKHQLFGLVLEFELKKIVSNCNLVNPKLELGFKTDEQNGGEKEC
ncbi:unnamed protein product [Porites lobata]|uniref:Uncharacterized protein n=1 Tax=Porites lobata TaxID=104759 RepID=A0ABN8QFA8_9CNID|nr:unnamed protein product [Porites lobata]